MNDKELFGQLNKLKMITPNAGWKERNRGVLLNQIFSGQANEYVKPGFMVRVSRFVFEYIGQPVGVMALAVFVLLGGGAFSWKISQNAAPGDSLYIAKLISEKTRSSFTFDEKTKTKLNMEFASNRVKELSQVLSEENQPEEKKAEKVEQLTESFKQEMVIARNRLAKLEETKTREAVGTSDQEKKEVVEEGAELGNETENSENGIGGETPIDDDSEVFSANLGKDAQGVDISDSPISQITVPTTTKEENAGIAKSSSTTQVILDEAEKLFDEKDYEGTILKLEEANNIILNDNDIKGEVKGESEAVGGDVGTSTGDNE